MKDTEKKYTITKIQKYKKDVEKLEKSSKVELILLSMISTTILSTLAFEFNCMDESTIKGIIGLTLCQFGLSLFGFDSLRSLIDNTTKKNNLETIIRELQDKIDLDKVLTNENNTRKLK